MFYSDSESISSKHVRRLAATYELAKEIENDSRIRIAATLWIRNDPISMGYNHRRTSPFAARYRKNRHAVFFHAETHAVKRAISILYPDKIENAVLYVARVRIIDGKLVPGMAKPCSGCQRMLEAYDIREVYYTTGDWKIEKL